jgi:adenylate cyclase
MSRRRKIQFKQLLILAVAWQLMALWICVYDHLAIHSGLAASPAKDYSFGSNLLLYSSVTVIATLLGGSLLIFYVNPKFANRSYARSLLAVVLLIVFVMSIITVISAYFYVTLVLKVSLTDPGFSSTFWNYISDPLNLKDTLIWSTITAVTQFIFLMNTKFGPGVFWKIITGKYRVPKAEDRIFMFLDLNSSTTIAESLGEVNYHRLLKDFFADITDAIVENYGEIYQYVGDEIVVSWNLEQGARDNRCIRCFFEMRRVIEKNRDHYLSSYGLVPSFKAGMHSGNVIAGEIGIFKRDITFSGDILNTASRIRSMCKEFDVELIASSELLHHLDSTEPFIIRELGSIELKGKKKRVELNSLTMPPVSRGVTVYKPLPKTVRSFPVYE